MSARNSRYLGNVFGLIQGLSVLGLSLGCGPTLRSTERAPSDPGSLASKRSASWDRGKLELFSLNRSIGSEELIITKQDSGFDMKLEAMWGVERWSGTLKLRPDFSVLNIDLQQLEGPDSPCAIKIRPNGPVMEAVVERPGASPLVRMREDLRARSYYVTTRPVVTQSAVCVLAGAQELLVDSTQGFTIKIAPRQPVKLVDGRTLDKVQVDGLVDIYCDGMKLAIVHYPKHAFLATRPEYSQFARQISAGDPTDQPWAGELSCR